MFALIQAKYVSKIGLYSRLFRRIEYVKAEASEILGMKTLSLTVMLPHGVSNRELARIKDDAIEILTEECVGTVCLHREFPYPDWFSGFRRPDGGSLARRLVTVEALSQKADSVFVYARRIDRVVSSAIRQLCGRFRYIMVSSPDSDTTDIARWLTETSGASVIANPTERRILTAHCAAIYDTPIRQITLSDHCQIVTSSPEQEKMIIGGAIVPSPALSLADGTPLTVPDGFDVNDLLSEAILRGTVKFEKIRCDF